MQSRHIRGFASEDLAKCRSRGKYGQYVLHVGVKNEVESIH